MITLKILGFILILLLLMSCGNDFYHYGFRAYYPKIDVSQESKVSLQEKMKVGITSDKEVYELFGKPDVYRKKVTYVGGEQNLYSKYSSATWTKAKTKVFVYDLETTELTVFFDDNAKVASFEIATKH